MAHPIVRTDLMSGTVDGAQLRSVMYYDGEKTAEVENGAIVKLEGMLDREVFKGVAPKAGDELKDLVLIASPEIIYEKSNSNLEDFINPKDEPARGYRLHIGNIFSVTSDGFVVGEGAEVEKGDVVEIVDGVKPTIAKTATEGNTKIGVVADIDVVGGKTYYAVLVG